MKDFAMNAIFDVFINIYPLTLASLDLSPRRGDESEFSFFMSILKSRNYKRAIARMFILLGPALGDGFGFCVEPQAFHAVLIDIAKC